MGNDLIPTVRNFPIKNCVISWINFKKILMEHQYSNIIQIIWLMVNNLLLNVNLNPAV